MSGDEGKSSPHHRPLQPESRDRRLAAAASPWHAYVRHKGVARSPEINLEESILRSFDLADSDNLPRFPHDHPAVR